MFRNLDLKCRSRIQSLGSFENIYFYIVLKNSVFSFVTFNPIFSFIGHIIHLWVLLSSLLHFGWKLKYKRPPHHWCPPPVWCGFRNSDQSSELVPVFKEASINFIFLFLFNKASLHLKNICAFTESCRKTWSRGSFHALLVKEPNSRGIGDSNSWPPDLELGTSQLMLVWVSLHCSHQYCFGTADGLG